MVPVDALEKHLFRVLVGNVSDHNRGTGVLTVKNTVHVDSELRVAALGRLL